MQWLASGMPLSSRMPDPHWNDALRTGHLGLDLKHKRLAQCLENVLAAQRDGKSGAIVDQLLLGLWKATEVHFAEEEELMRRVAYPHIERHVSAHRRIIQILSHKMEAYQDISCDVGSAARAFHAWFTNHTVEDDAELGAYISGEHASPQTEQVSGA